MFPLVTPELKGTGELDLIRILSNGTIPDHYGSKQIHRSLAGYVTDYLKEEVFDEGLVRNMPAFTRFFDAIGYSHGQLTNFSNVARDCAVDAKTVKAYYQILVDTLLGHLVEPYRRQVLTAIDHLRRIRSSPIDFVEMDAPHSDPAPPMESEEMATIALSIYLQLTPLQRSCVILKDVIDYSLAEISDALDISEGASKAALHRGRENLRKLAQTVDRDTPLQLEEPEASLLSEYVKRFNARDFDGVRAMLAADVRLDLVDRVKARGADRVGRYFGNYSKIEDWRCSRGFVEGRPVILVADPQLPDAVSYFILLEWKEDRVIAIRDYRYARHVLAEAQADTSTMA